MNHPTQTETAGPVRTRALLAALLFIAAGVAFLRPSPPQFGGDGIPLRTTPSSPEDENDGSDRRSLSIVQPDGGCIVTYAHMTDTPIAPTWMASYPGSGSRMTWTLVEALTGIRTNDDYDSHERGYEKVVTVKTHYPVKNARRQFPKLDPLFNRAIVILRNPINSIPSYFNLHYEHLHHLPNHSTRGPNKDWVEYRDAPNHGLPIRLPEFEKFVSYWMERYPQREQLLLISYEDLTDARTGPIVAAQIANFLGETEGVDPIAAESIPCVWETIVNYKNVAPPSVDPPSKGAPSEGAPSEEIHVRQGAPPSRDPPSKEGAMENGRRLGSRTHADPESLRTGPKERPYTEQNLADITGLFQRLLENYSHDTDFVRIMTEYIEVASNTVPQN